MIIWVYKDLNDYNVNNVLTLMHFERFENVTPGEFLRTNHFGRTRGFFWTIVRVDVL